jgi:predicted unusual protein kinase regulating ubiquinone biosynthesis (AarF/ABC1/UbiB family)
VPSAGCLSGGGLCAPFLYAQAEMWEDAVGKDLVDFNFRTITAQFSRLVYTSQIRVPERFALVIRTLLTQEGICLTLDKNFKCAPPLSVINQSIN